MKRCAALFLSLALLLCSCGSGNPENGGKTVLKLKYWPELSEEMEEEPGEIRRIRLEYGELQEVRVQPYGDGLGLDVFSSYVRDELGVELDSRWKVFVHFYDDRQTVGMVEFMYTIGEIDTNKSIIFNLDGGKADTLYYKNLDAGTDEQELLRRIGLFRDKYVQEKRTLGKGEAFESEKTGFTYYYGRDRLVYSYSYFFTYGDGVINNDWGTECFIDQEGNAVF